MFEKFPITRLSLAPGRSPGSGSQNIRLCGLTVFVGPNNSGKSLVLRELGKYLMRPDDRSLNHIATEFELTPLDAEESNYVRTKFEKEPPASHGVDASNFLYAYRGGTRQIGVGQFAEIMQDPKTEPHLFQQLYLNNFTITLDGQNRIGLANPQPIGDLQNPDPFQALQVLFSNDELRAQVRSILHRAFQKYFILDPTMNGRLTIRYADRAPQNNQEEQGLDKTAREFYASASPLEDSSDGVKAYTGIITQIVAGEPRVILIDEPEAFLHPPLAQQLAKEISQLTAGASKNVFVATHSANFVMGCIQSGAPVDIVRLTYRDGISTARILQNDDLLALTRHPLLRSTGVINALFYECVIVTESDSDRAFYQEINERLLRYAPGKGIPNCLFLNAQNKQTTRIITKPLRALGIPTLSIVDIDVLKEGGSVWADYLESGYIPELDRSSLATARDVINAALKATGRNMKTQGGISLLNSGDQESLNNLFDRLEEYGLFVVRGGEAESWLKNLGAVGHGSDWLVDMFDKLGEDSAVPDYIKPTEGDVWSFLERARNWLLNNSRKGIPE